MSSLPLSSSSAPRAEGDDASGATGGAPLLADDGPAGPDPPAPSTAVVVPGRTPVDEDRPAGGRFDDLLARVGLDLATLPVMQNRRPVSPQDIFCNRELNMHGIRAIGFDMDYTLAQVRASILPT